MSEFKVKGEIFNLLNMENNVVPIRDILETRKSLIRSRVLAIISDSSNANYIEDPDLQSAIMNTEVSFENIFTAYRVEPNYQLTPVTIPAIVQDTSSTITIQSTVTLSVPMNPAEINYEAVVTKTTNTIENTNYSALTSDERTVLEHSYRNAYIKQIASSVNGVTETDLQNATIEIILSDDRNGGVNVDFKIKEIPSSSSTLLESIQNAIVSVNNSADLSSAVKQEITTLATQYGTVMVGVDLNDIPATSEVFIALSRISTSGLEVDIPNLNSLLSKSLDNMTDAEKYVLKEAYADAYIEEAAKSGVVLSRNNVVIYLVSGSVKVVIKVQNIDINNTTFAQQVEDFFGSTASETSPVTPEVISAKCLDILSNIVSGQANPPPEIAAALQNQETTLYQELESFFQSPEFINAVETSSVENVTIEISADGEVTAFVIPDLTGIGKGIKKLPNKDASLFTDEKKRDAIKKGKLNNSVGGVEKESIVFQVKRTALRRARNLNYRVNNKYTKCC
jgi:hypothetical protein